MEAALVGVGTGVMKPLLSKLSNLVEKEYAKVKGVRRELESTRAEMSSMKAALQALEEAEQLDPEMIAWRDEVRELSFDMEDCVDDFVARADTKQDGRKGLKGFFDKLKKLKPRHEIAGEIKELKARAIEASERHKRYKLDRSTPDSTTCDIDPRLHALYVEVGKLVGIEGPKKHIIDWFKNEGSSTELRVVSIVGPGGLGKTTLGNAVFQTIKEEFSCTAFVSVSRKPNMRIVLKDIARRVGMPHDPSNDDVRWLIDSLRKYLQDKKYLIVIDDLWSAEAWKTIKDALLNNEHGSRIITTTRNSAVASFCSSEGDYVYRMEPLSSVDSRRLFLGRAFRSEDLCPPNLKEVSERILEKCAGLPLAIITMSSLLADQTEEEVWNKALAAVGSSLAKEVGAGDMTKILSLSYFDLPHYMRACLLYLSAYPEDDIIEKKSLIHKWMAEGFVREVEGQSTYEVGKGYFNDFINRSLIQPAKLNHDELGIEQKQFGEVMACRVHDIILDFITCKAKEENFMTSFGVAEHGGNHKVRRLSLVSRNNETATVSGDLSHVRSLAIFGYAWQNFALDFPVLRVLDLDIVRYNLSEKDQLANIEKLLLLKYLRLRSSYQITEMLEGIGKLKYLETLDMHGVRIGKLPSTMTQLQRLARLYSDFEPSCLSDGIIGQLQSLEELEVVRVSETELEKLLQEVVHLTKLRTLSVYVVRSKLNEKVDNFKFVGTLISSYNLHHLTIRYVADYDEQCFVSLESWCLVNPVALRKICISEYSIDRVPNWMIWLGNLSVLHLGVIYRTRPEDMAILGGMPSLVTLKLGTFYGRNGKIFVRTGFRSLKHFSLNISCCGTAVEFEEGSMPKLEHLKLEFPGHNEECVNYAFDFGIQHLSALTKLDLCTTDENDIVHKLIETALGKFHHRPILSWKRQDYGVCLPFETYLERVWELENVEGGGPCSFLGLLLEEIKQDALPRMRVMGMLRFLDDLTKCLCAAAPPAATESSAFACAFSEIKREISSADNPTKAAASRYLSAIARHLLTAPAAAGAAPDDLFIHLAQDLVPRLASGIPDAIAEAARVLAASPSMTFPVLFKPLTSCLASPDPRASKAAAAAFCKLSAPPADATPFLPLAPHLYKLLTTSRSNSVLINVLRVLARLVPLESSLVVDPVCQLLARSSDMSLVFECIRTILATRPRPAHGASLAIGKVKEFLSRARDPNLGLLALGMLYPGYANECRDVMALLLNDGFNSNIRREALNLLMEMVDGDNIIGIAGMLVSLAAKLSDPEFANEILGAVLVVCARSVYDELAMDLDCYVSLLAGMARSVRCASQLGDDIARQLADVGLSVRDARPELVCAAGTLCYFEDAQRFESIFRVKRKTFNYICSLVKPVEDITLLDGRVLLLQDQVAIALRMFLCGAPVETVLSDVGVSRSTFGLIFWMFVEAMLKQASHHLCWPDSMKMESTKSKFELIHGMPNCCGVVDTTYINTTPSAEPNCDHEKNHSIAVQAVVDPDSRITDIFIGWSDSILQSSDIFKACENGRTLNSSKLKLSDGTKVGEYIIGDEGHPLLPWLLTPYQEKELSGPKLEFNRRHSAARTIAQRVLARLKDTWKWMYLGGSGLFSQELLHLSAKITRVSCLLHNIVIDMEGAALEEERIPSNHDMKYRQQGCQLANENAVRVRDILSQHLANRSSKFGGTLSFLEDEQTFESFFKIKRKTFNYICCLVKSMEDVSSYTFLDGKVMRSEDQVAVALRMLISGGPVVIVASDFSIKESTVLLVTLSFVKAMVKRGSYHMRWPDSIKMEKMKSKFDLIHMLPNFCGVIYTTYISSAEPNRDREKNYSIAVQVVVDPEMRIIDYNAERSGTKNKSSILKGSLVKAWVGTGEWPNGSQVKLTDESEVGEYIIGDAGFPPLPWLLTPYWEKDLSSDANVEFNRRLSAVRAITVRGLARLKDTWKCLHGELWRRKNPPEFADIIFVCCMVHNIVIDMEGKAVEEEYVPNGCDVNYSQEVCQLPADENSVRMRDALSHHLASRPSRSAGDEEEQVVPSDAGDEEEQESRGRKAEEETHSFLAT